MPTTRFMPMFPLQLVVFPGEHLNLHIFEPRYKQLVLECEKEGKPFGIPSFIEGKMMDIGTEMRLIAIEKKYDNGEMDVRTEGVALFKIVDFYTQAVGKMYSAADVETLKIKRTEGDYVKNEDILLYVGELFGLLNIKKQIPTNTATFQTVQVAHHVGFTVEQEYEFLCLKTELQRQDYLITHIQRLLPVVREMQHLKHRALMNGHFKNITPPKF